MADIVDRVTRSRMMSGIRGRDTQPELIVRRYLHANGLRYRIAPKNLPGKPDIVLPKYRTVVFVHGCFWHQHADCKYAATPATNTVFWCRKFKENIARDQRARKLLHQAGWQVIVIWGCELNSRKLSALKKRITAQLTRCRQQVTR